MRTASLALLACALLIGSTTLGADPDSEALFNQLDRDGNGVLKADEIDPAQEKAFQRLLRTGDKDENGELTRAEYQAALAPDAASGGPPNNAADDCPRRPMFDVARLFERADKDGDGKLTREELPEPLRQRLEPLYERLGRDALSKDDLARLQDRVREARTEPGGPNAGPKDRQEPGGPPPILKVLDTDKDGRLSPSELAGLEKKFKRFDLNGDEQLDLPELAQMLNARPPRPGEDRPEPPSSSSPDAPPNKPGANPEAFFRRLDRDQDGYISKEEATEPMQRRFERIDQDGDGRLSADELARMAERKRPDGQPRPNAPAKKPPAE